MRKLSEIFTLGLGKFVEGPRVHSGMCSALESLNEEARITFNEYHKGSAHMEEWLNRHCVYKPMHVVYVKTYLKLYYPFQPKNSEEIWGLFREFYFFLIWDLARRGK